MNVLVLAPHPDDESIGCGGTICLHADRGDRVAAVFLTSGELGLKDLLRADAWQIREAEAARAAKELNIARVEFFRFADWSLGENIDAAAAKVGEMLRDEQPEKIYLPHPLESHPDHAACLPIVRAAKADMQLLGYEVWTPLQTVDDVQDISKVMHRKLRAIRCYRSQLAEFRYDHAARGLNAYRGELAARCRFAEAFQMLE